MSIACAIADHRQHQRRRKRNIKRFTHLALVVAAPPELLVYLWKLATAFGSGDVGCCRRSQHEHEAQFILSSKVIKFSHSHAQRAPFVGAQMHAHRRVALRNLLLRLDSFSFMTASWWRRCLGKDKSPERKLRFSSGKSKLAARRLHW